MIYILHQKWLVINLVSLFLQENYMFLKQSVNPSPTSSSQNFQVNWKANWFTEFSSNYKRCIYEDIFIRKYVKSFFFRWSKLSRHKVIGSLHLFRTLGKIYLNVFFFYPNFRTKKIITPLKKSLTKKPFPTAIKTKTKPIIKYKKQLIALVFFYNLEKLLGVQVFFKFRNICNSVTPSTSKLITKIITALSSKFSYFRHQFRDDIYSNTIAVLVHLFKFKKPDSSLLANYIASVLPFIYRHTSFLAFLKKLIQTLQSFFVFRGSKIFLSGKLNALSRAQSKYIQVGCVTLQSSDFPYTKGISSSFTRAGKIGVKVWIC